MGQEEQRVISISTPPTLLAYQVKKRKRRLDQGKMKSKKEQEESTETLAICAFLMNRAHTLINRQYTSKKDPNEKKREMTHLENKEGFNQS